MPDTVLTGSLTVADGTGGVTPPAGSVLEIGCQDHPAVSIDLEGAFTGTVVIEASAEDAPAVDWFTPVVLNAAGVAASASLTVAARRFISAAGLARVRLRCTAFASGPMTATLRAGQGFVSSGGGGGGGGGAVTVADGADFTQGTTTDAGIITNIAGTVIGFLRGGIIQWAAFLARFPAALVGGRLDVNVGATGVTQPVSGTVTGNQGTANTAANAWPAKVTDGTNVAAVKAASTAAVATDPAAVVTLSPNTALPAGSNALGSVTITGSPAISGTVTANQGTQNAAGAASWNVQGAGAAGAAVVGNPVRVGISDLTSAQDWRQALTANAAAVTGIPAVALAAWNGTTFDPIKTGSASGSLNVAAVSASGAVDSNSNTVALFLDQGGSGRIGTQAPFDFNGTNWDRHRNNIDVVLLASAARTTTQTGSNITAYNCQGIAVTVDVTVLPGAAISNVVTIGYVDSASGKVITLLTGAAIVGVGTTMYLVDPRVPAVANSKAQMPIGRNFVITITAGNGNSATYSAGYTLIPC